MYKINVIFISLLFISCINNFEPAQDDRETNSISVFFNKPAGLNVLIASAEAIVSASDIDSIITQLTVADSSIYGRIEEIPAGKNRKIEINCFDDNGAKTYSGFDIIDIVPGSIQTVNIILYPVNSTGTVIVTGYFSDDLPTEEKIVFQADYNGSYNIYLMSPYGTNIMQLTNSEDNDYYPHISPDRKKIVFGRAGRPFIMNIDGSNLHELNFLQGSSIGYLDWSPDGNQLVLHANPDGDMDIYIYDMSTQGVVKVLNNNSTDWMPQWSPDGQKITFHSNVSGIFKAYIVDVDGSDLKLLNNRSEFEERVTKFSPDGSVIAMSARNIYAQWGLFLMDVAGTEISPVINTSGVDERHANWSPDGKQLIFTRFDGGSNQSGIYTINLDGSGMKKILDTPGDEVHAHWR